MAKDACYHSVKARYAVFPSARASQAIAKCRKKSGNVKKTEKGAELKRWQKEKDKDSQDGTSKGPGHRFYPSHPVGERSEKHLPYAAQQPHGSEDERGHDLAVTLIGEVGHLMDHHGEGP